jgi:hypothetical protein
LTAEVIWVGETEVDRALAFDLVEEVGVVVDGSLVSAEGSELAGRPLSEPDEVARRGDTEPGNSPGAHGVRVEYNSVDPGGVRHEVGDDVDFFVELWVDPVDEVEEASVESGLLLDVADGWVGFKRGNSLGRQVRDRYGLS